MKNTNIDFIKDIGNALVAHSQGRNYPGVLLQGDSLRILLDDLTELGDEIASGNHEDAQDIIEALKEKISEILVFYEQALTENGIALPYANPVNT